jgi:PAS domain-containing protein
MHHSQRLDGCMNKDQLLAVLYDLSLTIGREVTVDALLTKVVQRLLFHTGCPVGLVIHHPDGLDANSGSLLKVIGDHQLQQQASIGIALPPGCWAATFRPNRRRLLQRLPARTATVRPAPAAGTNPHHHAAGTGNHVAAHAAGTCVSAHPGQLSRAIKLCNDSEQLAINLQAERNQVMVQLDRAQRFNQALLNAMPIAVFYKDASGRYLGCNPAFTRTVGMQPEHIIGKMPAEVWPAELASMFTQNDAELIASRQPQMFEYVIRTSKGS